MNPFDTALQNMLSFEQASRQSAAELRAMGVVPLSGPGADLLRAEVAAQVWHSAVRILAMAMGGREFLDRLVVKDDCTVIEDNKLTTGEEGQS